MTEEERKDEEEIVEGEIVAEYSDTMLNLPAVPGEEDDAGEEASEEAVADPGRRGFVGRVLLGGAAAAALGGSAALLYNSQLRAQVPRTVIIPTGTQIESADVTTLITQIGEMDAALKAITADRDRLRGELDEANGDLVELRAQLDAAIDQIARYQGLNRLWQQLDDIGLDDLLNTALWIVNGALATAMNVIDLLRAGLTAGQTSVDNFVAMLPGPQDGIRWLQRQISTLATNLDWLSEQVQEAVEPVEPFTRLIADFVLWVLNRLPFGVGSRARAGLEAMKSVVTSLPDLVAGVNTSVLDPLADWFGQSEARNLNGILLAPVTQNVFDPARSAVEKVVELEKAYKEELAGPAQDAIAARATLRSQIREEQARLGIAV